MTLYFERAGWSVRNGRLILLGVLLLLAGVAAALYLCPSNKQAATSSPASEKSETPEKSAERRGGRSSEPAPSAPDSAAAAQPAAGAQAKTAAPQARAQPAPQDFGRAPPAKAEATPQAAAVAEALKKKDHPERLSALLPPKPFDKAAFEANPNTYLNTVEPGRCFVCAQPGTGVPTLTAQSPRLSRIQQGESVKLSVKGAPLAPISFTSFDLGLFQESQLNCVTVRADQQGVGTVTFVAAPGALNDCNILAGSPRSSGQAKFSVEIEDLPKGQ